MMEIHKRAAPLVTIMHNPALVRDGGTASQGLVSHARNDQVACARPPRIPSRIAISDSSVSALTRVCLQCSRGQEVITSKKCKRDTHPVAPSVTLLSIAPHPLDPSTSFSMELGSRVSFRSFFYYPGLL